MSFAPRIPVTVVTGFLGAGKTSLIRHLLETANGRRLALIVNEFGDVGVDGEVLKACGADACREEDIVELANGCICCTVADDFIPTMEALLDRDEPLDHIVIETSGLALPKPLIKAFNWPEIRPRVTVDGVIALVDGPALAAGTFAQDPRAVAAQRAADDALDHDSPLAEVFEDQLAAADMVIVNKADLMSDELMRAARAEIARELRPEVKILSARHGAIAAATLLGLEAAAEDDLAARPSHHDGEDEHEHDDFETFVVPLAPLAAPEELLARLRPTLAAHEILRVKGFAAVSGKDMRLVIQGVGRRLDTYYGRPWGADEARRGQLVVIGQRGLDRPAIERAIQA